MRYITRILLGALYRPHDLIAYMEKQPSVQWVLIGITLLVFISPILAALWIVPLFPVLAQSTFAAALVTVPFFAVVMAAVGASRASKHSFTASATDQYGLLPEIFLELIPVACFWFAVMQITITPLLTIGFFGIALWEPLESEFLSDTQVILLMVLFGTCIGKGLSMSMILDREPLPLFDWRWLLVIALPLIAGVLAIAPQTRQSLWLLLAFFLLGVAWAQLRIENWLWQACWMIVLTRTTVITRHPEWLDRYALLSFDQLRLLPLPGTTEMLQQQSRVAPRQTALWLAKLMTQPNDRWLAQRVLRQLPSTSQAHAIIFWLSLHPVGKELLRSIGATPTLVQAYAQWAHVDAPGAWRSQLEQYGATITLAPVPNDIPWMPDLVRLGQTILEARRWQQLERALPPLLESIGNQSVEIALHSLQSQIHEVVSLQTDTTPESSWPMQLLNTIAEQLTFLQDVE